MLNLVDIFMLLHLWYHFKLAMSETIKNFEIVNETHDQRRTVIFFFQRSNEFANFDVTFLLETRFLWCL